MTTKADAALAWLDDAIDLANSVEAGHLRTLKAMLAEPRMPEEPDAALVEEASRRLALCGLGLAPVQRSDAFGIAWRAIRARYRRLPEPAAPPPPPPPALTDDEKPTAAEVLEWLAKLRNSDPTTRARVAVLQTMLTKAAKPDDPVLREAVKQMDTLAALNGGWKYFSAFRTVLEAARSTLPEPAKTKTLWNVNGCGRSEAPYERDIFIYHRERIAGAISELLDGGFSRVTVTVNEVAA